MKRFSFEDGRKKNDMRAPRKKFAPMKKKRSSTRSIASKFALIKKKRSSTRSLGPKEEASEDVTVKKKQLQDKYTVARPSPSLNPSLPVLVVEESLSASPRSWCETQVEVQRFEVACTRIRQPLRGEMHVIIAFLQDKKVCSLTDLSQRLKTRVDTASVRQTGDTHSTDRLVALWSHELVNNAEFSVRRCPFTFDRQFSSSDDASAAGNLELLVGVVNMEDKRRTSFPVLAVGRAALRFPTNSLFRGSIEVDVQLIDDYGKNRLFRIPNPKYEDIVPENLSASKVRDIQYFDHLLQSCESDRQNDDVRKNFIFQKATVHPPPNQFSR